MTVGITSPVTGSAQTGMTSPTFTFTEDRVIGSQPARRFLVSARGGSGTNNVTTDVHAVSRPFSVTITRPASFKPAPVVNAASGIAIRSTGKNEYKFTVAKGITAATGLADVAFFDGAIRIPAGADINDVAGVKALLSAAIGVLSSIASGFGDTVIDGNLGA